MLFLIKSKCITFIAQKTGIIHWFEIKNPTNTSQTDKKKLTPAFKREAVQFLEAKNPHVSHLQQEPLPVVQTWTANCKSNRKTVSRDILRIAVFHEKPDGKGLY